MSYILSLDQGTTSSRAILFDQRGQIAAIAQNEFRQIYPRPGWVEHDPMDILTSQMGAAVEVLTRTGTRPRDLAAIGITNQRETTILWDRETGKPVSNAIVWQDRRTADHCRQLAEDGLEDTVRSHTGLLLDPYFSATKVAWILDNVDGARERAQQGKLAFGTVDSFLLWRLTGGKVHATDATGDTLLMAAVRSENPEAVRLAGISKTRLLMSVYGLAGLFYGVAGLLLVARTGVGDPQAGLNDNLGSITAVVLGGTSLFGGRGNILGTLIGTLIVSVFNNGLQLMGLQEIFQVLITGVLVILAVSVDQMSHRGQE